MPSSSGNAISKTKALAMRRTTTKNGRAGTSFRASSDGTPRENLLSHLMEQHVLSSSNVGDEDGTEQQEEQSGLSFTDILKRLGMNNRNTKWRDQWKALINEGLITTVVGCSDGPTFTSPYKLTTDGVEEASTEEYKEAVAAAVASAGAAKKRVQTNEDLHAHIKTKLMNDRGDQIFDLLLKHEALSRLELADKLGIASTGAYFSYALQQLKDLGYAENFSAPNSAGKLVRLTDKAFVTDRKMWFDETNRAADEKQKEEEHSKEEGAKHKTEEANDKSIKSCEVDEVATKKKKKKKKKTTKKHPVDTGVKKQESPKEES